MSIATTYSSNDGKRNTMITISQFVMRMSAPLWRCHINHCLDIALEMNLVTSTQHRELGIALRDEWERR